MVVPASDVPAPDASPALASRHPACASASMPRARPLTITSPALASSLAAYFNFGMLFMLFRKRYGRMGGRDLAGSFVRMAACAAAMGAIAYAALTLSHFGDARHVLTQVGLLVMMIAASVAAYFGLAWLLRCEELSEVFLLLRRPEPNLASAAGGEI